MKQKLLAFCTAAFLFVACNNEKKTDTPKKEEGGTSSGEITSEPWVPVDSATMMKKMMEYGTPGEMHKMMASWEGTWTGDISMWHAAGAPPQKSVGTLVNKMILGGKFLSGKHTGDMMGMPFEGMSIMAYDNATKKFSSTWVDNMSTGVMTLTGDWDAATKTLNIAGKTPDICRPGKECAYREVFKIVDDNNQVMEMYGPDPATGKEYKMMEIKSTRK